MSNALLPWIAFFSSLLAVAAPAKGQVSSKAELLSVVMARRKATEPFTVQYLVEEFPGNSEITQRSWLDRMEYVAPSYFRLQSEWSDSTTDQPTPVAMKSMAAGDGLTWLSASLTSLTAMLSEDCSKVGIKTLWPPEFDCMRWYPGISDTECTFDRDLTSIVASARFELVPEPVEVDGEICLLLKKTTATENGTEYTVQAIYLAAERGYLPKLQEYFDPSGKIVYSYKVDEYLVLPSGTTLVRHATIDRAPSPQGAGLQHGSHTIVSISTLPDGSDFAMDGVVNAGVFFDLPVGTGVFDLDSNKQWIASVGPVDYIGEARLALQGTGLPSLRASPFSNLVAWASALSAAATIGWLSGARRRKGVAE